MRISATFLYAYIYPRLDDTHKELARKKFGKLVKDDTPMVRRGAAQSILILAEGIGKDLTTGLGESYLMPLLKSLLVDDSDGVKINAVYSSLPVSKLLTDPKVIESELVPIFKSTALEKTSSWRLRFALGEVSAQLAEFITKPIVDSEIVTIYESLLTDKEAEVRSEAVGKISNLAKFCSPHQIIEKILPIISANIVTD